MGYNHAVLGECWKAMLTAAANEFTLLHLARFAQMAIQKAAKGLGIFPRE